jgi:hypothetical protein
MVRFWIIAAVAVVGIGLGGCGDEQPISPPVAEPETIGKMAGGAGSGTSSGMGTTPTRGDATTPRADERAAGDPPPRAPQKRAGLYFPQAGPADDFMTALGGGTLVVRNRCIHMAPDRGGGVVVWPHGYSLRREGNEVLVLNSRGEVVAKVGEEVRMGGGQITQEEAGPMLEAARRNFEEEREELGVPDGCRGPLWVSSGVVR